MFEFFIYCVSKEENRECKQRIHNRLQQILQCLSISKARLELSVKWKNRLSQF